MDIVPQNGGRSQPFDKSALTFDNYTRQVDPEARFQKVSENS